MPHATIISPVVLPVAPLFTDTAAVDTTRCQQPRECREEHPQLGLLSVRNTKPYALMVLFLQIGDLCTIASKQRTGPPF